VLEDSGKSIYDETEDSIGHPGVCCRMRCTVVTIRHRAPVQIKQRNGHTRFMEKRVFQIEPEE
jgi:hypothetical protein